MRAPLQVLQDSLYGTSKVLLVCNISPEAESSSETLSSLNFSARAAQVRGMQGTGYAEVLNTESCKLQRVLAAWARSGNASASLSPRLYSLWVPCPLSQPVQRPNLAALS